MLILLLKKAIPYLSFKEHHIHVHMMVNAVTFVLFMKGNILQLNIFHMIFYFGNL